MISSTFSDCPSILSEFLYYMETIKNLSPRTIEGYYIDIRTFFRFLKQYRKISPAGLEFEKITISDITVDDLKTVNTNEIYEYLHYVSQSRKNNANTRSRKVSSLRSYFKYLTVKAHKLENDPVKDLEVPSIKKSLPKFLTLEESIDLLKSTDGAFSSRDYCILTLFLNCGMRLSELVGIDVSDIRGDMINITGKGNKERLVYLNDACIDAIEQYRKERDAKLIQGKENKALFLSVRGTRLTGRRVEQIVDECLKCAGLADRGFSAHKLRHTAATLMYRHGNVDMLALKEILGHEHVSTTEIYTHISDQKLRDAANASPLSKETSKKNSKSKNQ
ncbi:MAG: tyrosine recombinase XerC [Oscillospiraceae bacterium]